MYKYIIKVYRKSGELYTRGEFTSIDSLNNDLHCLSITETDIDQILIQSFKDDKEVDQIIVQPGQEIYSVYGM
jgi:hypothetical protein